WRTQIPAFFFLFYWVVMDLLQGIGWITSAGVAHWAHVGGFVAGFILAGILRLYRPVTDVCYIPSDCDTDKDIDEWKGRR
ncbi:MAG TPA: rhomboid family intramembrane serine protease, partial [Candidatus Melainabacteria bacterium]|nr:rhomboid family intramembrane serine protease [Candidatus Melainabacteria bacterium]